MFVLLFLSIFNHFIHLIHNPHNIPKKRPKLPINLPTKIPPFNHHILENLIITPIKINMPNRIHIIHRQFRKYLTTTRNNLLNLILIFLRIINLSLNLIYLKFSLFIFLVQMLQIMLDLFVFLVQVDMGLVEF
jgi:hypothetical protein